MSTETTPLPAFPSNVGQTRTIDSIDGQPMTFTIVDEILVPQSASRRS